MRANERTDERVAQYICSFLFSTIVEVCNSALQYRRHIDLAIFYVFGPVAGHIRVVPSIMQFILKRKKKAFENCLFNCFIFCGSFGGIGYR